MPSYSEIAQPFKSGRAAEVPDSWKQGRTAYGGLTSALCIEAARLALPDLPPLRSLQMNFTGPVTGDPEFEATLLRQGRNVTSVAVEARVEGGAVGNALALFGADRDSVLDIDLSAPSVVSPEMAEDFMPEGTPFVPNFIPNFELKIAGGARPMTGAKEGHLLAWVRHRDPEDHEGETAFVCLGDVLPPAAFPVMTSPVPISSANWTLNLLREPTTRDGWFLIESRQSAARAGYSSQVMRFWNTDGQMIAEGMQCVAVFG